MSLDLLDRFLNYYTSQMADINKVCIVPHHIAIEGYTHFLPSHQTCLECKHVWCTDQTGLVRPRQVAFRP
jgi:hypothetical protein